MSKILVIGACGQIGIELVIELRKLYGVKNVIASDIRPSSIEVMNTGPFEELDIMNEELLRKVVAHYQVTQVYLLAALLSATAEKNIALGWELNMRSHSHVLDLAKDGLIKKNGETLNAQLVVLATGYKGQDYLTKKLFGAEVAARVGQVWGVNPETQELNNMWTVTGQPGLWYTAGSLSQCRIYSKYLAMQIKAMQMGQKLSRPF